MSRLLCTTHGKHTCRTGFSSVLNVTFSETFISDLCARTTTLRGMKRSQMSFFKTMMNATRTNGALSTYLAEGAVVVDVRSKGEFSMGHVKGSKNIPLQNIPTELNKLKASKTRYVLCCASGNRSGQAERFLSGHGIDCINGGSWQNVASAC